MHRSRPAFAPGPPLPLGGPRREFRAPRCALAGGAPGDASTIASIDELAVHAWKRIFGGNGGGGANPFAGKASKAAPVSAPVTSFPPSNGTWQYILSTTVVAKPGMESRMATLLATLDCLVGGEDGDVLTRAVNQDPDERETFLVLERFASQDAMTRFQKRPQYQAFLRDAQPMLARPLGVYLCKEQDGKITPGYYPFGPAGEGGRDDMVFR